MWHSVKQGISDKDPNKKSFIRTATNATILGGGEALIDLRQIYIHMSCTHTLWALTLLLVKILDQLLFSLVRILCELSFFTYDISESAGVIIMTLDLEVYPANWASNLSVITKMNMAITDLLCVRCVNLMETRAGRCHSLLVAPLNKSRPLLKMFSMLEKKVLYC